MKKLKNLFRVGIFHTVPKKLGVGIEILGLVFFLLLWTIISHFEILPRSMFPTPLSVIKSIPELHYEDALIRNAAFSIQLNFYGYLEAILITIPLGFLISLIPFFRHLLNKYVDAIRFIPLTACTGLFIAWFGIETDMKVHFLSFGIIVYLLPVIIQRINETEKVHVDTIWTLGANNWQTFRYVYWPASISKISDDIRVIVAISWTYIIIAEMVNNTGGIGSLIYIAGRQSRIDKVFAILIIIILIGFLQDKLFKYIDKKIFKFKYATKK